MADSMTDSQLLAEFARTRSSEAFAEIVRRHVDLVYGTARRLVEDEHLAQDVAQAAFIVLAQKAKSVESRRLPGWLVNTTRLAAKRAWRGKLCREKHEGRAAQMRSSIAPVADEPTLEELTPLLDEALSRLNEADRTAVVTRFLQGKSFAEVGAAMGASEEAARKRVERAVEKLRAILMKRGVAPSVGGLMVILAANQAQAVPDGLAGSISTAAISGGAGTSAVLAKGVMRMMALAKVKVSGAAAIAVLALLAAGAVTLATGLPSSTAPTASAPLTPESGAAAAEVVQRVLESERQIKDFRLGVLVSIDGKKVWELDWGYDRGKEFYAGIVHLTVRGKPDTLQQGIKWAFDGEKMRTMRRTGIGAKAVTSGSIRPLDPEEFRALPNPRTLMGTDLQYRGRSSCGEALMHATSIRLRPAAEVVDGRSCLVLEAMGVDQWPDGSSFDAAVWIDHERGYRPLRYEKYFHEPGKFEFQVLHERVDGIQLAKCDGVWFPIYGEFQQFHHDFIPVAGVTEKDVAAMPREKARENQTLSLTPSSKYQVSVDVKSVKVNRGIPNDEFTIVYPPGSGVMDEFTKTSYIVEDKTTDEGNTQRVTPTLTTKPSHTVQDGGK